MTDEIGTIAAYCHVRSATEFMREKGERQGYYTKAQFAQLMGFSVRTLERRISANLLNPPVDLTDSGEVRIDLKTRIVE